MGKEQEITLERTESKEEFKPPKNYMVVLHNDDRTSFEFVIFVLQKVFNKSFEESLDLTQQVHNQGRGIAGIFPKEIAEAKADEVVKYAQANGFPLKCTSEEE